MRALLLCLLFLTACARPLTENERAFLSTLHGSSLDPDPIRLSANLARNPYPHTRKPRPRTTCTERIYPELPPGRVWVSPAAMAGFRTIWLRADLYREDFLAGWPEKLPLWDAMLFAHEITHIWQWEQRETTRYHPFKGAFEHVQSDDPYLFDPESRADFLAFGYEQQAAIVEEFVCCRALDPEAPRTLRLREMLAAVMPVAPLEHMSRPEVLVPWEGVQRKGICS